MVDTHCHLNFHKFDRDLDEVAKRAFDSGVRIIVNTGTSIPSSRRAVELANKLEKMYAIVGIHPHHADKADTEFEGELQKDWLENLGKIATDEKVIGIGEIGLDYYRYKSNGIVDKKIQEETFRKQIELSIELKLPLQIHNRLAWDDTLGILLEYKSQLQESPGMFHCFSGSIEFTKRVLEAGFYLGFDGNITYDGIPPGEDTSLKDLVKYAPMDRILTETDSPFLAPIPLRGKRNTPENVIIIVQAIARIKNAEIAAVETATENNFKNIFGKHL